MCQRSWWQENGMNSIHLARSSNVNIWEATGQRGRKEAGIWGTSTWCKALDDMEWYGMIQNVTDRIITLYLSWFPQLVNATLLRKKGWVWLKVQYCRHCSKFYTLGGGGLWMYGVGTLCWDEGEGPRAKDLSRSLQPDKARKPFFPSGEETQSYKCLDLGCKWLLSNF